MRERERERSPASVQPLDTAHAASVHPVWGGHHAYTYRQGQGSGAPKAQLLCAPPAPSLPPSHLSLPLQPIPKVPRAGLDPACTCCQSRSTSFQEFRKPGG